MGGAPWPAVPDLAAPDYRSSFTGGVAMFAVIIKVELPEGGTMEEGKKQLEANVIPQVKASPGFDSGYWLSPKAGREGLSVLFYSDEQSAKQAAEMVKPPEPVKLLNVEVREVVAKA
ncbi:MAG: hypothetical protein NVSMB29_15720 [Candidatus Dormibacteria bacterium]